MTSTPAAEMIAKAFHEAYEKLAPEFGYKTREASAVPWEDVPQQNKDLMIRTVESLLGQGIIADVFEANGDWYVNLGDAIRVRNGIAPLNPPVA